MTEHEIKLAKALGRCSFLPGHPHKRFARDMAGVATHKPDQELTPRQRHYMQILAWRYRKQMPYSLVPVGKPLDLLPRYPDELPAVRRLVEPEPVQAQMFLVPKLPPVFMRELDL